MSQVITQIGSDGKRHPVRDLDTETTAPDRIAGTQVDADGRRHPAAAVTRKVRAAAKALVEEDPGRTLDRSPAGFAGTQIGEDGIRRPLADVNADAARQLRRQQKDAKPPAELETASDPSEIEPVTAARATRQGTAPMVQSPTAFDTGVNDRVGGGYRDGDRVESEPVERVDDDPRTKDELLDLAREYELSGYSDLSKIELSDLVIDNDPRTVTQLRKDARALGIEGTSKMNKPALVKAIAGAPEPEPEPEVKDGGEPPQPSAATGEGTASRPESAGGDKQDPGATE